MAYKTPGVYVEDISLFPPSVAEVETAIPAFIGYTEKTESDEGESLINRPLRITSLAEYESIYGGAKRAQRIKVVLDTDNQPGRVEVSLYYQLYYSLRLFFDNGGSVCYIVSVGGYDSDGLMEVAALKAGIEQVGSYDEPTLLLFPDGTLLGGADLSLLQQKALEQCGRLKDRFAILDLDESTGHGEGVTLFRNNIGNRHLKYGAAYTPYLKAALPLDLCYQDISLEKSGDSTTLAAVTAAAGIKTASVVAIDKAIAKGEPQEVIDVLEADLTTNGLYKEILLAIGEEAITLPPSGAVAGVYAWVDDQRGVWKAPANVSLGSVLGLTVALNNADQEMLNVDPVSGKSINAIRAFTGQGIIVWGARTLAGNDNEWRYVPVRRLFIMVEESLKRSTAWALFEPNDGALWTKLKGMMENYLIQKWRAGALQGVKPEEAFFVKVGVGETMTAQDLSEGNLVIQVGMAAVRPGEFTMLRITQKMREA